MEPGRQSAEEQIQAAMQASAEAWNRGDLEAFMEDYLKTEDMTFTSGGKILEGYPALKERYQTTYGEDRASMGQLRFDGIKVWPLGDDHALALGHWYLEREGQESLEGVFSLVMTRTGDGWKILHDHTSRLPPEE